MNSTKHASVIKQIMVAALILMGVFGANAEGISWRSYAEIGVGLSMGGGIPRSVYTLDTGIFIGSLELGSYIAVLPLEFGQPDLLKAGAVYYGGTIGAVIGESESLRPFGRLSIGGFARERADEQGVFNGDDAERYFSMSFIIGVDIPINSRSSIKPYTAWRLAPEAKDYEERLISGPEVGCVFRTTWDTTLR